MKVGVLALQGAAAAHARALADVGATPLEVRTPEELARVDALVLPGGESTTISKLLDSAGLREPLGARLDQGLPVFGTCAGMILLATDVRDGRPDQRSFGRVPMTVRRNGYGRQLDSFETELDVAGIGLGFPAVFIRAPVVERVAEEVEVLATVDDRPVLCRHGSALVAAFHPELSRDRRLHELFLDEVV